MKFGKILYGLTCFMLGAAIFGGGITYAAGVMAERSTNTFYVDGKKVELPAYGILGNNYVKLRDVGQVVGFNVYWNGAVQIQSDAPYTGEALEQVTPVTEKGGAITIPQSDELFIPKEGDRILCDDGTEYEIKDMSRYDNNVFADGKLPPLPTATCNWSLFPENTLPKAEARHFSSNTGENLFIRNLYETRRMEYTIRNALWNEPDAWKGDELLAEINLTIPEKYDAYTQAFWPWRASELEKLVHSVPNVRYYIEAWDYYHNGVFQHTRYCVFAI